MDQRCGRQTLLHSLTKVPPSPYVPNPTNFLFSSSSSFNSPLISLLFMGKRRWCNEDDDDEDFFFSFLTIKTWGVALSSSSSSSSSLCTLWNSEHDNSRIPLSGE